MSRSFVQPSACPAWLLWPGLIFVGITIAFPVFILFLQSVFPHALGGDWSGLLSAYLRMPDTYGLLPMLWNSLLWGVSTTVGAWILGIPCGYLLARTNMPAKSLARLALLIPVMSPAYISALSYILIMQPGGFADNFIGVMPDSLRGIFFSFWGVTFVMVIASFGGVALAVEAALRGIPTRLEDAAISLGASGWGAFRLATLPLLIPALGNLGVLVFLDALSNFGVPAIMGPRCNLPLLPAEIYFLVTSWPIDLPLATALSALLCLLAVCLLSFSRLVLSRIQQGRFRPSLQREHSLSVWGKTAVWCYFGFLFFLGGILPNAAVVLTSLVDRWQGGKPSLTLTNYSALMKWESGGASALLTSFSLSTATATVCVVFGALTAYALARRTGWLANAVDGMGMLPRVVPRIVLAVAFILAWNAPWITLQIYNTVWILLLAYLALYQSDALRFGDAAMRQIGLNLEQAASSLGASRWQTLRWIVWPLLKPSLLAAWITTFVVCMRDWVASIILLPPGLQTVGSFIFNQFEQGEIAQAMAMATCTVLLSSCVLVFLQLRRSRA